MIEIAGAIASLLQGPKYPEKEFVRAGATFGEVYAMAAWLRQALSAPEYRGGAVCLAAESKALVAAALLASLAGGPSLLLPYAFSARALARMRQATGFSLAISEVAREFPDGVRVLCPPPGATGKIPVEKEASPDAELLKIFTGGTTGAPQVWVKTGANILGECFYLAGRFGVTEQDCIMATIPAYHIYGLLFSVGLPLVASAAVVDETPSFPREIARVAEERAATILVSVPAHYRVLREMRLNSPLRLAFSSAGMLDATDNAVFCRNHGTGVVEVYGSTETGGIATRNRSLGEEFFTPFATVDWKSVDGRLAVRSPYLSPDLGVDADGFFTAGDRVEMVDGNRFALQGRADTVTKVGGKRVDLEEIRLLIKSHPGVADCAVMALPESGGREHQIGALLQGDALEIMDIVDIEAIRKTLADTLEPYALPRRIRMVERIPLKNNGKYDWAAIARLLPAMSELRRSFAAGYAGLAAWADLLDGINVFPVADGDTGTNLRISLAPLRDGGGDWRAAIDLLARVATGNSGNIAAPFFREFCQAESFSQLAGRAEAGRIKAWQAVAEPRPGTMLTVFKSLAGILAGQPDRKTLYEPLTRELGMAVHDGAQLLRELREAGVVDAGALAMYIFFDGFFHHLTGQKEKPASIPELFAGKLTISRSFRPATGGSYCVDVLLEAADNRAGFRDRLADLGESVVVVEDETRLKVHLHTADPGQLRQQLGAFGEIVRWSAEPIVQEIGGMDMATAEKPGLHIVTDGAGSLTRSMARALGITLLDSYIVAGDSARPESLYRPEQIYPLMRQGAKITTAQASTYERQQHYQRLCRQFGRCLYLSVGSAFTGNFAAAMAWKEENDPDELMTVLDTGAASGRLALIALLTARRAGRPGTPEQVVDYARQAIADCDELVFIDELKYLVAGGRVSRAGGFFGDLLSMKPVITPTGTGVRKVGVVRSTKGQLAFALARLTTRFTRTDTPLILLQYSDNEPWVAGTVAERVRALLPRAEILITPLSLTSGVHMGPGTWSVAFGSGEETTH